MAIPTINPTNAIMIYLAFGAAFLFTEMVDAQAKEKRPPSLLLAVFWLPVCVWRLAKYYLLK